MLYGTEAWDNLLRIIRKYSARVALSQRREALGLPHDFRGRSIDGRERYADRSAGAKTTVHSPELAVLGKTEGIMYRYSRPVIG